MYDIFELAEMELKREGKLKSKKAGVLLIDRAFKIRRYLDIQDRNKKVANKRRKKEVKYARDTDNRRFSKRYC